MDLWLRRREDFNVHLPSNLYSQLFGNILVNDNPLCSLVISNLQHLVFVNHCLDFIRSKLRDFRGDTGADMAEHDIGLF